MSQRVTKSLGEIALRVNDIGMMRDFYADVIELELIREESSFAFFKIADGLAGHTQVLALFDRSERADRFPVDGTKSSVDHIAFSVSKADYEIEKSRLLELGCQLTYAYHQWVQWQSLYVVDPEGNTVEFVCFDPQDG